MASHAASQSLTSEGPVFALPVLCQRMGGGLLFVAINTKIFSITVAFSAILCFAQLAVSLAKVACQVVLGHSFLRMASSAFTGSLDAIMAIPADLMIKDHAFYFTASALSLNSLMDISMAVSTGELQLLDVMLMGNDQVSAGRDDPVSAVTFSTAFIGHWFFNFDRVGIDLCDMSDDIVSR